MRWCRKTRPVTANSTRHAHVAALTAWWRWQWRWRSRKPRKRKSRKNINSWCCDMAKKPRRKTTKSRRRTKQTREVEAVAQPMEYKSVLRLTPQGATYESAASFLEPLIADGWKLIAVGTGWRQLENEFGEIFYLERAATGVPSLDSPPASNVM